MPVLALALGLFVLYALPAVPDVDRGAGAEREEREQGESEGEDRHPARLLTPCFAAEVARHLDRMRRPE